MQARGRKVKRKCDPSFLSLHLFSIYRYLTSVNNLPFGNSLEVSGGRITWRYSYTSSKYLKEEEETREGMVRRERQIFILSPGFLHTRTAQHNMQTKNQIQVNKILTSQSIESGWWQALFVWFQLLWKRLRWFRLTQSSERNNMLL